MDTVTVIFTKSLMSPISWLIRWVLPRSRFALGRSSHCFIKFGDVYYQAELTNGVSCTSDAAAALKGCTIVDTISYEVPDAEAGHAFVVQQIGKKYDLTGVLGLGLNPSRNWSEDNSWFCYELAAGVLKASGLDVFDNLNHVTEIALMAIRP